MPPFLPRKRLASTPPPNAFARGAKKTKLTRPTLNHAPTICSPASKTEQPNVENSSDSSLSDVDSDQFEDVPKLSNSKNHDDQDEDEDVEWQDAAEGNITGASRSSEQIRDIQLTLSKGDDQIADYGASTSTGKKGPTRREKEVRIMTHCLHVQFLLYHNAIRNNWIADNQVQETLVNQLPIQIRKEVEKWRVASGLQATPKGRETERKPGHGRKSARKSADIRNERDWGRPSERLEQGKPDLSNGDPLVHLMKVLSAYWKKRFFITAPGIRKRGYGTKLALKLEIHSLRNNPHDLGKHGEKVRNVKEFRELAKLCEGSRDLGAQLFTALVRGLGIEARLVASLQPSGFGWTKAERMSIKIAEDNDNAVQAVSGAEAQSAKSSHTKGANLVSTTPFSGAAEKKRDIQRIPYDDSSDDLSALSEDESLVDITPRTPKHRPDKFDRDLAFPIYWTEVVSPIDHSILAVSPLVLSQPVASTPEVLSTFEPRGAKAEKGKQVIAYVVAYSSDGTAKDVTVRYLRKHIWPGKTKGFRMPVEKIPVYDKHGKVKRHETFDWFKTMMSGYLRSEEAQTAVDTFEDIRDLVPAEPERRKMDEDVDTLQNLKASADFVLERHLRREEALRPGSQAVRGFTSGKGNNVKEESVFRRSDVERCLTAESWHKEGRRPKQGENPMKMVLVRAVTLTRKREAEEHERQTGKKQTQGLYSWDQTEYIILPPIKDGFIPKNSYGNMDCFVPSMVPKGAVHIPLKGTVRICKKLEIDYAEAVTGFEFGNKRAVPVCTGVVVAAENEKPVRKAWKEWNEEQRRKELGKREKTCLDLWKKMTMGLRIRERVAGDYADEDEANNVEQGANADQLIEIDDDWSHGRIAPEADHEAAEGGFLLPHEDEDDTGELVMEQDEDLRLSPKTRGNANEQCPTPASMPPVTKEKQILDNFNEQSLISGLSEADSNSASEGDAHGPGQGRSVSGLSSSADEDTGTEEEQDNYVPRSSKTATRQPKPSTNTLLLPTQLSTAAKSNTTPRTSKRLRKNGTVVTSPYFDGMS